MFKKQISQGKRRVVSIREHDINLLFPDDLRKLSGKFSMEITNRKNFHFHGLQRVIVLGKAIASFIVSKPQIHEITRSTPMPKPPWGTLP